MLTNSIHKKMYKTIVNLIDNQKSELEFLSGINKLKYEMKEGMPKDISTDLPEDLIGEISKKVFEEVRAIINGAGPNVSARFTLLLSNPEIVCENKYRNIVDEYFDVGTVYLMACMALSGQKAKAKDALGLVDYLNSAAMEIETGIKQQQYGSTYSKRLKIIACMLAISTIILSCTTYYFHQKLMQTNIDYAEMESERDSNFTDLMEAEDSLDVYYENFAFVTKSGTKYHKDGCPYTKDRELYVDSIADLKPQGYKPCSRCYGGNFLIWE